MLEAQKIILHHWIGAFADGRCSTIREMQDEHAAGKNAKEI